MKRRVWRVAVQPPRWRWPARRRRGSSDDGCGWWRRQARAAASRRRRAPGITATTVTVGGHFPLTGPAAPGYSEIPRAIDAYFQYVNANGGVHGRKLKMIIRDDGYNPANTVKVTKQLVLQDKVFAILGGLGTPTHTKVVDYLNAVAGARPLRVLGLPLLGRAREAPVHVRLAARLHWSRARSSASTSPRTSRARRSPTSSRTTTSAPTAPTGLDMYVPKEQVVTRADLRARQHRHRPADGRRSRRPAPRSSPRSRSPPTPRCQRSPASSSTSTRSWWSATSARTR